MTYIINSWNLRLQTGVPTLITQQQLFLMKQI